MKVLIQIDDVEESAYYTVKCGPNVLTRNMSGAALKLCRWPRGSKATKQDGCCVDRGHIVDPPPYC